MKKLITLIIAGMMAFSVVACGNSSATEDQTTSAESQDDSTSQDSSDTEDGSTDEADTEAASE